MAIGAWKPGRRRFSCPRGSPPQVFVVGPMRRLDHEDPAFGSRSMIETASLCCEYGIYPAKRESQNTRHERSGLSGLR